MRATIAVRVQGTDMIDGVSVRFSGKVREYYGLVRIRDEKRLVYFGCCSVLGLAASSARFAIHASYSGVPRRGGVSAGRPPIACGIKSPTCTLLQDGSDRTARQRNADLIALVTRLISGLCRRIVAPG